MYTAGKTLTFTCGPAKTGSTWRAFEFEVSIAGATAYFRASAGGYNDDGGGYDGSYVTQLTGWAAFVTWRAAYLSKQLSWSNMMLVPMFWFKSMVFGRDVSRF